MRSPNHPIVRAATRDPEVLARFRSSFDRSASADDCWVWRERRFGGQHPVFRVRHHAISAARVAWFDATGEFPLGGRIRHTCGNIQCVRPEHLEWQVGQVTERVLRAESAGYVPVAEVRAGVRSGDDALYRRAG